MCIERNGGDDDDDDAQFLPHNSHTLGSKSSDPAHVCDKSQGVTESRWLTLIQHEASTQLASLVPFHPSQWSTPSQMNDTLICDATSTNAQ